MYPKTESVAVATPITITANYNAVPPSANISISTNGGAIFNAAKACSLNFTPSCPFQGATNNVLPLTVGNNNAPLLSGVTPGTYDYTVSPAEESPGPPITDQFDVVVGS